MSPHLIPVLARVDKHDVSICELVWSEPGVRAAIPAAAVYQHLGTVKQRKVRQAVEGVTYFRTKWVWFSEGYSGTEDTKAEAVAAMLRDAGCVQVEHNDTIEPLFEMEES